MKRILLFFAAVMLIVGIAGQAMALDYERGEFLVGIFGTNNTIAMEFGSYDIATDEMTEGLYVDLFDITEIGSTFAGDTSLADLQLAGAGVLNYFDMISFTQIQNAAFAVQKDSDFTISSALFNTLETTVNYSSFPHDDGVDGTPTVASNGDLAGSLGNGTLNGFLGQDYVGTISLADLTADNFISMDIYTVDGNDGWTVTDTNYDLVIGLDGNMVYAQVSTVPIPGALVLLGSGLLALVGVRRRRNA
jgi:hypothetical protein